jgi:hypothetical protein
LASLKTKKIPFAVRRLVDPTGTEDFRLRHYDGSQFGYQRPPIEVSDNEEEDDDGNESDDNCSHHDRNRNCNRNGSHRNSTDGGRIQ